MAAAAAAAAALAAACAPSAQELCQSLADRSAHCDYQVADDAVARCAASFGQATGACRASMLALGGCIVGADCDQEGQECRQEAARYQADCADPNAFGSAW